MVSVGFEVFSGFSFHSVSSGGALVLVNVGDEGCVGQCHDRVRDLFCSLMRVLLVFLVS